MNIFQDWFQGIAVTITSFFIVVTSILPWSATNTNKPADTSIATPSATVSETPKPTPTSSPKASTAPIKSGTETVVDKTTIKIPTQQTYSIIPLGDISSLPANQQAQLREIYNEFLRTPGLQYLTHIQQDEVFKQITSKYLQNYKNVLQQDISNTQSRVDQLKSALESSKQQSPSVTNTPAPTPPPFQPDPSITAKLDELRQTLIDIQNRPVAMNIIEGRKQAAYQKWMQDNFETYAIISVNSYYANLLNSIKRAYGL